MSDLSPYVKLYEGNSASLLALVCCRWEGSTHPEPLYRFSSIEADGAVVTLDLSDHLEWREHNEADAVLAVCRFLAWGAK